MGTFTCPMCRGTGEIHSHNPKCPECWGKGFIEDKTELKTVEDLYSEHLNRVEKGVKEEWSAWTFTKAVGLILGRPT